MGLEIFFQDDALRWIVLTALYMGAVYVPTLLSFLRFRQHRWLVFLLRAIWSGFALLLFSLSVLYMLFTVPMMFIGLLASVLYPEGLITPLMFLAAGGAIFALWKGLFFLFRYQEKLAHEGLSVADGEA